jgi:sugar-specific transcriptional regulator TrmB
MPKSMYPKKFRAKSLKSQMSAYKKRENQLRKRLREANKRVDAAAETWFRAKRAESPTAISTAENKLRDAMWTKNELKVKLMNTLKRQYPEKIFIYRGK